MSNWDIENPILFNIKSKRCWNIYRFYILMLADEKQGLILQKRTRKQFGFRKHLKSIADAYYKSTLISKRNKLPSIIGLNFAIAPARR